jgi:iron complex outermembrane receptor protein
MHGGRPRRLCGAGLVLWAVRALAVPHTMDGELTVEEGDASLRLVEFSKRTGIQVLFTTKEVSHQTTQSLDGSLVGRAALEHMLEPTSLEARFLNPHTAIVRVQTQSGEASSADEITIHGRNREEDLSSGPYTIGRSPENIPGVGLLSLPDVMRQYTEAGGVCDDGLQTTRDARSNSARACSLDLRRLGTSATLVLVDGRRLAPSGVAGLLTDLRQIPTSAVEDIQTTEDMSSALYGSDGVAGVVNFRLRREFHGLETHLTSIPGIGGAVSEAKLSQLAGVHLGEVTGVAAFEYTHRDDLPANRRSEGTSNLRPFGPGGRPNSPTREHLKLLHP